MISRIRQFIAWCKLMPFPPEPPEWSEQDEAALAHFLQTETGRKMEALLNDLRAYQFQKACTRVPHSSYEAGWAGGWHSAVTHILLTLSGRVRPQQDNTIENRVHGERPFDEYISP